MRALSRQSNLRHLASCSWFGQPFHFLPLRDPGNLIVPNARLGVPDLTEMFGPVFRTLSGSVIRAPSAGRRGRTVKYASVNCLQLLVECLPVPLIGRFLESFGSFGPPFRSVFQGTEFLLHAAPRHGIGIPLRLVLLIQHGSGLLFMQVVHQELDSFRRTSRYLE